MRTLLNAVAIVSARQTIAKGPGQTFYETPKAIELWQDEPLPRRIKRWNRKAILWIIPDKVVVKPICEGCGLDDEDYSPELFGAWHDGSPVYRCPNCGRFFMVPYQEAPEEEVIPGDKATAP